MPPSPAGGPRLRRIQREDVPAVLALNDREVELTSPLDAARLDQLLEWADRGEVVEHAGRIAGFVLTFGPHSDYDSANYRWFANRYADRFYYLDRIVVGAAFRRLGLASFVYEQVEADARRHSRMALEVNIDPPNEPSLAFHRRRGYEEVGRLAAPGHLVSLQVRQWF